MLYVTLIVFVSFVSATAQAYKFKTFQTKVTSKSPDFNLDAADTGWKSNHFLVVVNLTDNKINIYAKVVTKMDLVRQLDPFKDDDGDTWVVYNAVDDEGRDVIARMLIYNDQSGNHVATLILDYSRYKIYYRLTKDE